MIAFRSLQCKRDKSKLTHLDCQRLGDKPGCYWLEDFNQYRSCGSLCNGAEANSLHEMKCKAYCEGEISILAWIIFLIPSFYIYNTNQLHFNSMYAYITPLVQGSLMALFAVLFKCSVRVGFLTNNIVKLGWESVAKHCTVFESVVSCLQATQIFAL